MHASDDCSICHMLRKTLKRFVPCRRTVCFTKIAPSPFLSAMSPNVPCLETVEEMKDYVRKPCSKSSPCEREPIVECSNLGDDWPALENSEMKYKTPYSWIRSGETERFRRAGAKTRVLFSEKVVEQLIHWLEKTANLHWLNYRQSC